MLYFICSMSYESIINDMISFGKTCVGVGRGDENNLEPGNHGPFWASNKPLPPLKKIKKEGVVCTGLIALLMRSAGMELFYVANKKPKGFKGIWGIGGTDEWMFQYKDYLEPIDVKAAYPKGTLLFRNFNEIDYGHVSMLIESCEAGALLDTNVLHTAGSPVGKNKVTCNEKVRTQHEYYKKHPTNEKPQSLPWDKKKTFQVRFNGPYYTHVLRPEYWVDTNSLRAARALVSSWSAKEDITDDAKRAIFALARDSPDESLKLLKVAHKASKRVSELETRVLEEQVSGILKRRKLHK